MLIPTTFYDSWSYSFINSFIWITGLFIIYKNFGHKKHLFEDDNYDPWILYQNYWKNNMKTDFRIGFGCLLIFSNVVLYYAPSIFYHILNKFRMFDKYKIQQNKNASSELVNDSIKWGIIIGIVGIIYGLLFSFDAFKAGNKDTWNKPLPNLWIILYQLLVGIYMFDIFLYIQHRAFHHPKLYKYHKKHHEFITPTGIYIFDVF